MVCLEIFVDHLAEGIYQTSQNKFTVDSAGTGLGI
jgi:hypothetical protein